jgi:hypothetical protein
MRVLTMLFDVPERNSFTCNIKSVELSCENAEFFGIMRRIDLLAY